MNTLVTGTFEGAQQAAQAVRKLGKSCVPMDVVRTVPGSTRKRHPTVKVAIKTAEYVAQQLAIRVLREFGASDIECRQERRAKHRDAVRPQGA
jgi:hypothetical protein